MTKTKTEHKLYLTSTTELKVEIIKTGQNII